MMFPQQPGGRETRRVSVETEVTIALKQGLLAAVAGLIAAFLWQRFTVGIANDVIAARPAWQPALDWYLLRQARMLFTVGVGVPPLALWVSMLLNVFDGSWPPTRRAQAAEDGPNAPRWLRWVSGWRNAKPATRAIPETDQYEGRAPSIPDPEQQRPKLDILIHDPKTKQTKRACPDLTIADWQRLARYFERGGRSVSQGDLEDSAHFSRGRGGRARVVNKELTDWQGLTRVGEQQKPLAIEPFAAWVVRRGYATDEALPSPV